MALNRYPSPEQKKRKIRSESRTIDFSSDSLAKISAFEQIFGDKTDFNFTVGDLLEEIRTTYRNQCAYVAIDGINSKGKPFGRREVSFENAVHQAQQLSIHLMRSGVERGDRVALFMSAGPEWMISFLAIALSGAVTVPVDTKLGTSEVLDIFSHVSPKAVLIDTKFAQLSTEVSKVFPAIIRIKMSPTQMNEIERENLSESSLPKGLHCDDLALIVYTSGSSGNPRGVMILLRNMIFEVHAIKKAIPMDKSNKLLSILPPNHLLELSCGLLYPIINGVQVAFCNSLLPDEIVAQMRAEQISDMLCVPLFLRAFKKSILLKVSRKLSGRVWYRVVSLLAKLLPFTSIRRFLFSPIHKNFGGKLSRFVSGGAPLEKEIGLFFEQMGITVLQGYGLTETSPVVTVNLAGKNLHGSVGIPLKDVEVRISETGEILVRGPNVMLGYYGREDLTRECIDENSWFHTGDTGHIDERNFLHVTGRSKELIVSGSGKKIFPDEVEQILLGEICGNTIKELCVVGARSDEGPNQGSEEVCLVVVGPPNGEEVVRSRVQRACKNLAAYKRPTRIILRSETLPRTTTMKVKRAALRTWIEQKKDQA